MNSTKCTFCGTENKLGQLVCRGCGITLPQERMTAEAAAVEASSRPIPRSQSKRRSTKVIWAGALLLALAMAGGVYAWREQVKQAKSRQEQLEEQQRQDAALAKVAQVNAQARDCLARRNFERGLELVDELLNVVEAPELLETKVDLLNNAGRGNEAYLVLQRLLELRPDAAYLQFVAAAFATHLKGAEAALHHYEEAARFEPANNVYQITLANAYVQQRRVEDGFALFAKLVEQDPNCLECWYNYGNSLFGAGQYERTVICSETPYPDDATVCAIDGYALQYDFSTSSRTGAAPLGGLLCYRHSGRGNPRALPVLLAACGAGVLWGAVYQWLHGVVSPGPVERAKFPYRPTYWLTGHQRTSKPESFHSIAASNWAG